MCDMLFAFFLLSQNLWWVTVLCRTHPLRRWFVFHSTAMTTKGGTMWRFGVWNKSALCLARCRVCRTENANFLPPALPRLSIIRALLCHSIWTEEISPICCVYNSFVRSLVHIRAYGGGGDSWGAKLDSRSEVSSARCFFKFVTDEQKRFPFVSACYEKMQCDRATKEKCRRRISSQFDRWGNYASTCGSTTPLKTNKCCVAGHSKHVVVIMRQLFVVSFSFIITC